jgi:hypothetical protein
LESAVHFDTLYPNRQRASRDPAARALPAACGILAVSISTKRNIRSFNTERLRLIFQDLTRPDDADANSQAVCIGALVCDD